MCAQPDRGYGDPQIPEAFFNTEGLFNLFREFCSRVIHDLSSFKDLILENFQRLVELLVATSSCGKRNNDDYKDYKDDNDYNDSNDSNDSNDDLNDEMERMIQGSYKKMCDSARKTVRVSRNDSDEEKKSKMTFCALIIPFLESIFTWLRDKVRECFNAVYETFGYVVQKVGNGIRYVKDKAKEGCDYVATKAREVYAAVTDTLSEAFGYVWSLFSP